MNSKKTNLVLPSNKKFGFSFSIIFLFIFFYFLFFDKLIDFRIFFLILSVLFLLLTIIYDKVLFPLNLAWLYLGLILGKIISPIILSIFYFFIITPVSLFLKLIRRDVLELKINTKKTMWKKVKEKKIDVNYFKNQY